MSVFNLVNDDNRAKVVVHYSHATKEKCEYMVARFAGFASAHRRMMMNGDEGHAEAYRHYMEVQGIILMQMHRRFGAGFPHHLICVVKDSREECFKMYRR